MPESRPKDTRPDAATALSRGKATRRRLVLRVVLISVALLALVTGLTVAYAYHRLNGNIVTADYSDTFVEPRPKKAEPSGPQRALNILVMGSDSREGAGNNIDNLTGQGQRSDTTVLLHLSADRQRAYGISIPRDSLVTRPDCRRADGSIVPGADAEMWNEAFNKAGPGCTISQFESLTDIRVDHYVVLDFRGFQDMVDAVDGVPVCIPETIDDREYGIYLEAGTREISGKQALSYVRERHGVGDGSDIGRLKRQQAFMSAMVSKVVSAGTLSDPFRLYDFLDAATRSLTLDPGLENLREIAELGFQFKDIGLSEIQFTTIPWKYTLDRNRVVWLPRADDVWRRLDHDEPLTAQQTRDAISAGDLPGEGGRGGGRGGNGSAAAGLCS